MSTGATDVPDRHDCGGDAAAYVLGALDAREAEAFRQRLETCSGCREQLAALRDAAELVPLAAPQLRPPRRLRQRVLAEVSADVRRRRPTGAPRVFSSWRGLALGGGVILAVALGAVGGAKLAPMNGAAPSRVYASSVGNAQLRVSDGHAVLIVHGLKVPRGGSIYEVWVKRGAAAPSPTNALFSVTLAGDGTVDVPGSLVGARAVLVTLEPAGGTQVPTTAPVIVTNL